MAPKPSTPVRKQSVRVYQLPLDLCQISNSLKIDDPPTNMRIGKISNFMEIVDPLNGSKYWIGLTWAEIFFPVVGERPKSVVGSKAYEVVLNQPFDKGGQIVRENVATIGKVVGVVEVELPQETVSVRIEDWFVQRDVFKSGRWEQRAVRIPIHAR